MSIHIAEDGRVTRLNFMKNGPVAHHAEPASTVGELIDALRGLPSSLQVLDSFGDPLVIIITADYVDVGP